MAAVAVATPSKPPSPIQSFGGITGTSELPSKDVEVLVAEMENRIRGTVLKILRPALDKVSEVSANLQILAEQSEKQGVVIATIDQLRDEVKSQSDFNSVLSEHVRVVELKVRAFETTTCDAITELRLGKDDNSKQLEEHYKEMQRLAREGQRAWVELQRLDSQHEQAMKKVWNGIAGSNRRCDDARQELMELVRILQQQREELLEDLYSEGKGLNRLSRDLGALTEFVAPLPDMQTNIQALGESLGLLDKRQKQVEQECQKNEDHIDQLSQTLVERVAALREDFTRESNRLVAHHAALMSDIRDDFREEIANVRTTREEIAQFTANTDKFCQAVAEDLKSESRRVDSLHRELAQDMDELHHRRKKDRAALEVEIAEARKDASEEHEEVKQLRVNLEFFSRIFGLVLEGGRVACALQGQDFTDRIAERLLGGGNYQPSQVPFAGGLYDRQDLLTLLDRLFQKAHTAFVRGPRTDAERSSTIGFSTGGCSGAPALASTLAAADLDSAAGPRRASNGAAGPQYTVQVKAPAEEPGSHEFAEAHKVGPDISKLPPGGPRRSLLGGGPWQKPSLPAQLSQDPPAVGGRVLGNVAEGPLWQRGLPGGDAQLKLPAIRSGVGPNGPGELRDSRWKPLTAR